MWTQCSVMSVSLFFLTKNDYWCYLWLSVNCQRPIGRWWPQRSPLNSVWLIMFSQTNFIGLCNPQTKKKKKCNKNSYIVLPSYIYKEASTQTSWRRLVDVVVIAPAPKAFAGVDSSLDHSATTRTRATSRTKVGQHFWRLMSICVRPKKCVVSRLFYSYLSQFVFCFFLFFCYSNLSKNYQVYSWNVG